MTVAYHTGNNIDILRTMPDNSVDSVVTDPPYGLGKEPDIVQVMRAWCDTGHYDIKGKGFMGKEWDAFVPQPLFWKEVYRVLKPGGHMVVACGTRTQDWMAASIRFAGFEIRNCVAWLYGSGFPKSLNISKSLDSMAGAEREVVGVSKGMGKQNPEWNGTATGRSENSFKPEYNETAPSTEAAKQWSGFGTDLKPAMELWTVARKPLSEPTVAANVLKWGTGGLNIDGSRVETEDNLTFTHTDKTSRSSGIKGNVSNSRAGDVWVNTQGRFPANVIHDNSEEVVSLFPVTKSVQSMRGVGLTNADDKVYGKGDPDFDTLRRHNDQGSAARFFKACEFTEEDYPPVYYCAKASRSERNEGLGESEKKRSDYSPNDDGTKGIQSRLHGATMTGANNHATVKPVTLMRYLCRLITPPSGTILDPFCGSGTTGVGAVQEGFSVILIDQEKDYMDITQARVNHAMYKVVQSKSQLTLSL